MTALKSLPLSDCLIMDWLDLHRDELQADWQLARDSKPLNPISPLE
jgi:hypothetical protein